MRTLQAWKNDIKVKICQNGSIYQPTFGEVYGKYRGKLTTWMRKKTALVFTQLH